MRRTTKGKEAPGAASLFKAGTMEIDEGSQGAPGEQGLPVLIDSSPRAHTQWHLINVG